MSVGVPCGFGRQTSADRTDHRSANRQGLADDSTGSDKVRPKKGNPAESLGPGGVSSSWFQPAHDVRRPRSSRTSVGTRRSAAAATATTEVDLDLRTAALLRSAARRARRRTSRSAARAAVAARARSATATATGTGAARGPFGRIGLAIDGDGRTFRGRFLSGRSFGSRGFGGGSISGRRLDSRGDIGRRSLLGHDRSRRSILLSQDAAAGEAESDEHRRGEQNGLHTSGLRILSVGSRGLRRGSLRSRRSAIPDQLAAAPGVSQQWRSLPTLHLCRTCRTPRV